MNHDIQSGLVRILDGAGFVVAPESNLIVTCAHVLNGCVAEGQEIDISFYRPLTEEPNLSSAKLLSIYDAEDIAILEIDNLPSFVRPLWLGSSKQTQGNTVSTTGFPGFEGLDNWSALGQIVDEIHNTIGQPRLQIQSLSGIARGFSGAPLWDEKRKRVIGIITTVLQFDTRSNIPAQSAFAIPSECLQKVCNELRIQDICPYKGLSSYCEEDAAFFFGREAYLQELIDLLQADHRFLMLLGPNGGGKTSLVQAGLVPLLRQNGVHSVVFKEIITYAPAHSPLDTLLALPTFCAATTLPAGVLQWHYSHTPIDRLALIIDPFEDLFHKADDLQRQQFIDQLIDLIRGDLATIIVVMRDDYYSDLARYETLIQLLERQISNIPHLKVENVRDIIQKPAQIVGLGIEENLVNTIADETMSTQAEPRRRRLHRQNSTLPLLSYALQQMFLDKEDFELTTKVYRQIGGISGCLPDWATQTYHSLTSEQQVLARRIFTDLVVLGDESSGLLDRKRELFLTRLLRNEQERPAVRKVIDHFTEAHLLETYSDESQNDIRVGIIHETLLHEWPLLQGWLQKDHQFLTWRQSFLPQAEMWYQLRVSTSQEEASSALLRENELVGAQDWWEKRGPEFTEIERLFLEESQERVAQDERQQKAYEQAEQQRQIIFAQNLALQALLLQEQQPYLIELSILLAAEAMKRHPSFEADKAFRQGLQLLPRHLQHIQRTSHYKKVVSSSDGSHLAAAGAEGMVWIRNAYDDASIDFFPDFGMVHALALSPDGAYVVIVCDREQVRDACLIDLSKKQEHRWLECRDAVFRVLFRKGEAIILTESGQLLFWQLPIGSLQHKLHHSGLTAAALSPDEHYLATAGRDGDIKIWDLSRWICVKTLSHEKPVNIVAFHPDHHLLATASGQYISIWDWTIEKRRFFFEKSSQPVYYFSAKATITHLAFGAHGDLLVVAYANGSIDLWDFRIKRGLFLYQHRSPLQTLQIHPDGHLLATAEENGTVYLWDLTQNNQKPAYILPHPGPVRSITFHPFKPYLATASYGGGLRFWQYGLSNQVQMFNHAGTIQEMIFYQDEDTPRLQVAIKEPKTPALKVWTIAPESSPPAFVSETEPRNHNAPFIDSHILVPTSAVPLAFSRNKKYVAVTRPDNTIVLFKRRGEQFYEQTSYNHTAKISALAISTDDQHIALADETPTLSLWNWREQRIETLPWEYPQPIHMMVFSDDQSLITVSHMDTISIWNWREQKRRCIRHHPLPMRSLDVSSDGQYFLTMSDDQSVRVWNCTKGELLCSPRHITQTQKALFSPKSLYLATISTDYTVRIWEATTGRPLAELEHNGEVYALAFSMDEAYLATASKDQHVRIWKWGYDALFREARYHMTRNLTPEEWGQYFGDALYQETLMLDWREEERISDL